MRKSLSCLSTRILHCSFCFPWHYHEEWSIKLSWHPHHEAILGLPRSHPLPNSLFLLVVTHWRSFINRIDCSSMCVFVCLIPMDKKAVGQGIEDWRRWTRAGRRNIWRCCQPFLLCPLVLRHLHSCLPCWLLCRGDKAHPSCTLFASAASTQHSLSLDGRQPFSFSAESQAGTSQLSCVLETQ